MRAVCNAVLHSSSEDPRRSQRPFISFRRPCSSRDSSLSDWTNSPLHRLIDSTMALRLSSAFWISWEGGEINLDQIYEHYQSCGLVVRVSALQLGDRCSIPGRVRPKTVKSGTRCHPAWHSARRVGLGEVSLRHTSVMSRGCTSPLVHQVASR